MEGINKETTHIATIEYVGSKNIGYAELKSTNEGLLEWSSIKNDWKPFSLNDCIANELNVKSVSISPLS